MRVFIVIATLLVGLGLALLAYTFAKTYVPLFKEEDNLIEWLSVALFMVGAVAGLLGVFSTRYSGPTRLWLGLLGFLSVLGALDELSFGERVFGFEPPEVQGVEIDGVHDFYFLLAEKAFGELTRGTPLAWVVLAVTLLVAAFVAALAARLFVRYGGNREAATLFTAFCLLIGAALVIDLHLIRFGPIVLFEEMFEMTAALALAMTVFALRWPASR